MKKRRLIPRLDVKGPNVVKGVHLEGLRVVGKPGDFARRYYEQGADELVYIDIVASLYERNNLLYVIEEATSLGISIPLTVGGGIRRLEDIRQILRVGADKVVINTAATRRPEFITEAARMFGSQCIVGEVQAKRQKGGGWEAYVDNGRERTGLEVIDWAKRLVELGAGELLITSVDREGTEKGYEIDLIKELAGCVPVPVIASGGAGGWEDVHRCFAVTGCDAVSMASILHYEKTTIEAMKKSLAGRDVAVRQKQGDDPSATSEKRTREVSIVDYGLGNLRSVSQAFIALGHDVKLVSRAEEIWAADLLVLPGVGSFADGMKGLWERGLVTAIKEYAGQGRPLLGICLGMQLLMSESQEFGSHRGLNVIAGQVAPFATQSQVEETGYRVPHVGWNRMSRDKGVAWENTILEKTSAETDVYFVHSFKVLPVEARCRLAQARYGGQEFCAVMQQGQVYGTQFHPEKSGTVGMAILDRFCQLGAVETQMSKECCYE